MRTEGYQWYKITKGTAGQIIKVDVRGKYTVGESIEHQLGQVSNLWTLRSSSNKILDIPLKRLSKQRFLKRGDPEFDSFDQYKDIRTSCWIIEEVDGQYLCDCPVGMKVILLTGRSSFVFIKTIYLT